MSGTSIIAQIFVPLSMKPACTCSTFHFNSSPLFAFEVICMVLSSADFFFKISFFVVVVFFLVFFGNISRVSSGLDPDQAGQI